jgi:hypothetical protein
MSGFESEWMKEIFDDKNACGQGEVRWALLWDRLFRVLSVSKFKGKNERQN